MWSQPRSDFHPVNNFSRILPFVWPHRRKVYLSFLFAGLVALFWSVNLSVAFPVVKVLLQGESLEQYVGREISDAEKEIEKRSASLKHIESQLEEYEETDPDFEQNEHVSLLRQKSRQQSKISEASRHLHTMNWLRSYVVPLLPGDQFDLLAFILFVLLIATILKGLCVFMQDVLIGSVVELTTMGIRKRCFRSILELDYQTLRMNGSSDLMSRFTYDLNLLAHGMRLLGGKVVREPLKAACCVIGAFFVCWQLTLLSLLFVPLVGLVFYRIGRKLKQASRRMMESMSRIYKTLEETIAGAKIVIAFNGARRHRQRFHRENKEYYRKSQKIIGIDALTSPTTEVLGLLAAFIALLPGAYLVLRGTTEIWGLTLTSRPMDIAELSLLYVLLAGTIDPVRKLSTTYAKLKRGSAAADRILALMDQQSLVAEPETAKPMPRLTKSIEFQNVEFSYTRIDETSDFQPTVLNGVSLEVPAGDVVVVVGENGSGKSTLVNLLPRYFDPDHGDVRIDGISIRDVRLRDLRSQIGVVTQETLLFDETIYENIRYGKLDATHDEIIAAADRAHVTPFVEQFPDGFETRVGEKGGRLSGGQRQRIALARAMLRDPAILILDEATSAIDAQSELLIHEALRHFVKGRTTFLITHSVSRSILDFVTRIAVMEEGRLVANGTHEQLVTQSTTYRRLYDAQVRQRTSEPATEVTTASLPPQYAASSQATQQRIEDNSSTDYTKTTERKPESSPKPEPGKTTSRPARLNGGDDSEPHIIPLHSVRRGAPNGDTVACCPVADRASPTLHLLDATLTDETTNELPLIRRYFPEIPNEQYATLCAFADEIRAWNAQVNLISRKDIVNLEERHILHSLAIARVWSPEPGTRIADVGTGGGLPGMPLAILYPESRFTLIDFVGKKARAVADMADHLKLDNVEVISDRAENIEPQFDVVLGRAVSKLPDFLACVQPMLKPDSPHRGVYYFKGTHYRDELAGHPIQPETIWELSEFFDEPYFVEKFLLRFV
eukprot:g21445.t1